MTQPDALLHKISKSDLPRHIAIIMDGNGRWAKKRGMPRIYGHRAGSATVRTVVEACSQLGVEALTLYAFSTENWSRPASEVHALMRLLCLKLKREIGEMDRNNVRLSTIGRIQELPAIVQKELKLSMDRLSKNTGLKLTLALNYGGRQEILDAVNRALSSGAKNLDDCQWRNYLYTNGQRDPDLLIRTSGEMRVSNFLLYQIAYTELYVTQVLWPDFGPKDLYQAILDYQKRERRFGGV